MRLPHLGHVPNAFGSCAKRIWVMCQTHLGHVPNAFGVQEGIRGSGTKKSDDLWEFPRGGGAATYGIFPEVEKRRPMGPHLASASL